jgi:hypothetical protein
LLEHQNGEGANHTRKQFPVELVYTEKFDRIDEAYYRERQIHGWSHAKKLALIERRNEDLPGLAISLSAKEEAMMNSLRHAFRSVAHLEMYIHTPVNKQKQKSINGTYLTLFPVQENQTINLNKHEEVIFYRDFFIDGFHSLWTDKIGYHRD